MKVHALFIVDLVQMLRHGELFRAAETVHRELAHLHARRTTRSVGDNHVGGGGPWELPTPDRAAELGYAEHEQPPTDDFFER